MFINVFRLRPTSLSGRNLLKSNVDISSVNWCIASPMLKRYIFKIQNFVTMSKVWDIICSISWGDVLKQFCSFCLIYPTWHKNQTTRLPPHTLVVPNTWCFTRQDDNTCRSSMNTKTLFAMGNWKCCSLQDVDTPRALVPVHLVQICKGKCFKTSFSKYW